ncbi:MAG: hypothetical protein VCE12_09350 [Candidatus Latescibacterota bacterium]
MSNPIHSEDLHSAPSAELTSSTSRKVLRGEIDGLRTISHSVAPGQTLQLETSTKEGRVCLFTAGSGTADDGTTAHQIGEVALWAPCHATPLTVEATDSPLLFLELVVDLSPADMDELERNVAGFPLFISYSDCKTYSERIKSDKTISRTLLPEYTFPRLCVGSVETTGDDRVAAHEHPMLEQLFLGLQATTALCTPMQRSWPSVPACFCTSLSDPVTASSSTRRTGSTTSGSTSSETETAWSGSSRSTSRHPRINCPAPAAARAEGDEASGEPL